MATQSQELSRLGALFPLADDFHFPIKQRADASFHLPTTTYCFAPKLTAEIAATNTVASQLIACFDGEILLVEKKDPVKGPTNVLLLRPNVGVSTRLADAAPEDKNRVAGVAYQDIDKDSLRSFVEEKLISQNVSDEESDALADKVARGKRSFKVEAGEEICIAPEPTVEVYFVDTKGFVVHPVYFLWKWLKLGRNLIPADHPALEHYDWQTMELVLEHDHIYGAISQGTAVEATLGAYNSAGY
jgi:hypothetical protein